MFCSLCMKYNKQPFNCDTWNTTPCTRYRLQSIISHDGCAAHCDSVKLEAETAATVNITEAIQLPEVPEKGMEQAFSCLYFLVKQRIPHTNNFELLLDLLGHLGITVKSNIQVAKNTTYTSHKALHEMLVCLSEVIENHMLKKMRKSDHFSLMFDETTDCTMSEQLAIHGRYILKETGELRTHYLEVIDILEPEIDAVRSEGDSESCIGIGASTITKRIEEYTEESNLNITKPDRDRYRWCCYNDCMPYRCCCMAERVHTISHWCTLCSA